MRVLDLQEKNKLIITKDIFRAYDIRGVYGEELDANIGERVGLAFGNYLKKEHS